MSKKLSSWLQSHGFKEDPFGHYTADTTPADMLQNTYIYDPALEHLMLGDQSVALLAPYGGGKTMARRYWQTQWQKHHSEALIVTYNDFSMPAHSLPDVTLDTHTNSLLGSLAKSVWHIFTAAQERMLSLTESDQMWWWALLNNYFPKPFHPFQLVNYATLQESYTRLYSRHKPEPFVERQSLDSRLDHSIPYLNRAGFSPILIFVDEVDAQEQNTPIAIEKIVFPLLNSLRLFSNEQIIWKYFLPDSIAEMVQRSSAVRKLRVETKTIHWNQDQLKALLQSRLAWATHDAVNSLEKLKLDQEIPQIDDELVTLVVENQSQYGAPRTLLLYGRTLFATLANRGDTLITKAGWQKFLDLIHKKTASRELEVATTREQIEPMSLLELRQILVEHFNLDDLRDLCFQLNINDEEVPGNTLSGKARELVQYCDRHHRLHDLKEKISQARPNLFTSGENRR